MIKKHGLFDLYNKNKTNKTKNKLKYILENEEYSSYDDVGNILNCTPQNVLELIKRFGLIELYTKNKYNNIQTASGNHHIYNKNDNKFIEIFSTNTYHNMSELTKIMEISVKELRGIIAEYDLHETYINNRANKKKTKLVETLKTETYSSYDDLAKIRNVKSTSIGLQIRRYGLRDIYIANRRKPLTKIEREVLDTINNYKYKTCSDISKN